MSQPQTLWEAEGGENWTTLASEQAFLEQIADETDLRLSTAGYSSTDKTIWRAEIGNPNGTPLVILSVQHGHEPAPRESAFIWIRDIAYSTDTEVADFLDDYLVVLITTVNADSIEILKRENANNVDLNRDWFQLTQSENRAVQAIINELTPIMIIDLHEWNISADFDFGYAVADVLDFPRHPSIVSVMQDFLDEILPRMEDAGFINREYNNRKHEIAQQHMTALSVPVHSLGFLVETKGTPGVPEVRVATTVQFLEETRRWLTSDGGSLIAAQAQSISDAEAGVSDMMIPVFTETGGLGPWEVKTDPGSYTVPPDVHIPQGLLDYYGIEVDGRTVSTNQKARGFIPTFFDPLSYNSIYTNTWHDPVDPEDTSISGHDHGVVKVNDVRYKVQNRLIKMGGIRYMSQATVTKKGDTRYVS